MDNTTATIGDQLKASGLSLTLGTRKRLEAELLKLRATPEAARSKLRELGLSLEWRQKMEATLQLEDRAEDLKVLTPSKVPANDSGFIKGWAGHGGGKKRLKILCLHGFASNSTIAKVQVEWGLGLSSVHNVTCDLLRSTAETTVRDSSVDRVLAPSAAGELGAGPTSTALAAKAAEAEASPLISQTGSAFDQVAKQDAQYEERYETLKREKEVEKQKAEFAQYLGMGVDVAEHISKVQAATSYKKTEPVYSWFDWPNMPSAASEQRGSLHAQLRRVMGCVAQHGPYDGIFGFSQGALMATILSSRSCFEGLFGLEE